MKKVLFVGLLLCASFSLISQDLRVEPLNWWVGMKNPNLQLLIKGKDLQGGTVSSVKSGLTLKKVTNGDSPNYLFVDLLVETGAQPGTYPLVIKKNGQVIHFGEKNQADEGWINGGFFILEPEVKDLINDDFDLFETGALPKLANLNQLMAYHHAGFWQPMDTLREKNELEKLALLEIPPWLDKY
jgi:hypothetical protein